MKIYGALSLFASTACAFVPGPSSPPRLCTEVNLYDSVNTAIAEAQRICALDPSSQECKVAWDIVEELEAADSHTQSRIQEMQTMTPSVEQSMDYVVLMGSFEILTQKIDGKMDQLQATTDKLESLGVNNPNLVELGRLAGEMKHALANTRASFSQ